MNLPVASTLAERRVLYDAVASHDVRFDGRVFVGVRTTGIYCRPVCSARLPKFDNCSFYTNAAAAEKAGFRPCLLCRPELAPGDARVDATSRLARLALRRIEDGALNESGVDALAAEFGVSARHLRRVVGEEFGVTPVELAQTQRLLAAKQLLTETDLSVTDVAFSAGFDSLRRFNALFKARYRLAPGALRRTSRRKGPAPRAHADGTLVFRLDYRPPFNWRAMADFLGARAIPGVEGRVGDAWARTVCIGEHAGIVSVAPAPRRGARRETLGVTLSESLRPVCVTVLARVKTVFDLRANSAEIDRALGRDALLRTTVKRHAGMRLPGAFDGFELALRAVLGQQVSVRGATTLAGRMAAAFGEPAVTAVPGLTRLTPTAARVADASVSDIAAIGMPRKRAETIRHVARAVADGDVVLAAGADPDRT
ncbi:MAG: bifunctional transcriptional activator/DNA repair enzyme AdaA, partial [Gammaproteobacteria bacterium]